MTEGSGGIFDFNATLPLMALQLIFLNLVLFLVYYKPVSSALYDREIDIKLYTSILDYADYYLRGVQCDFEHLVESLNSENDLLFRAAISVSSIIDETENKKYIAESGRVLLSSTFIAEKLVYLCENENYTAPLTGFNESVYVEGVSRSIHFLFEHGVSQTGILLNGQLSDDTLSTEVAIFDLLRDTFLRLGYLSERRRYFHEWELLCSDIFLDKVLAEPPFNEAIDISFGQRCESDFVGALYTILFLLPEPKLSLEKVESLLEFMESFEKNRRSNEADFVAYVENTYWNNFVF
jgi:hypothetical protein